MGNKMVAHALLVDRNGLVRWRASADPSEDELKSLLNGTEQLRNEIMKLKKLYSRGEKVRMRKMRT